jgi:capsular polysaccharide biosynthesis protein
MLVFYPKAHREEYGAAILQLFRDQCRDAWAGAQAWGLMRLWLHVLPDLLKTSVLEHLSNLNPRKSMLNIFRSRSNLASVFFSVFAAVFVLVVAGSIVITLLYPKTYRSTARIMIAHTVANPPSAFSVQTEFELIRSHAVLSKTAEALNLSKIWGKKYNGGKPMNEESVEALIKSTLELRPVRNTKFIEICAFSDNPEEAAKLANGVACAYRDFRAEELLPNAITSVERTVAIMDHAVPDRRAIRPNKPLNIFLGIMSGLFMGFLSGAVAAGVIWFVRRRPGNTGSPGQPASSDILA